MYVWLKPDDTPFYVGKGTGDRWKRIGKHHRSEYFHRIINKYPGCYGIIVEDHLDEETAFQREIEWIAQLKSLGFSLANHTKGGEGKRPSVARTEEYRERVRQAVMGEKNPNYGNHWTDKMKRDASRKRKESGMSKLGNNPRAKKVMCVETGTIYDCQQEASDALGLKGIGSIHHALKKPWYVASGFHFVQGDLIDELNTSEKRQEYLSSLISLKSRFTQ